MAVANTLATIVSNLDATPVKRNDLDLSGARVRKIVSTLELAVADDDGSVYRMARVHSSWSVHAIRKYHDAITSGTDFDVGLYRTAEDGGAVVDINAYADAVDISSADVAGTEIGCEARDVANIGNKVWEDAGLTADPNLWYDIAFTGVTVGAAAGTLSAVIEYSAGN